MIIGAHTIIYSNDAEADRAFFRDVLKFDSVDAGDGWLIFKAPPAELAVHPTEGDEERHELYLMTDDINKVVTALKGQKIQCTEVTEAGWGSVTSVTLPGGGTLGIYEPRHELAIGLK
jgi:hypothetical protein